MGKKLNLLWTACAVCPGHRDNDKATAVRAGCACDSPRAGKACIGSDRVIAARHVAGIDGQVFKGTTLFQLLLGQPGCFGSLFGHVGVK